MKRLQGDQPSEPLQVSEPDRIRTGISTLLSTRTERSQPDLTVPRRTHNEEPQMRPHHLIAGAAGALLLLAGCGQQTETVTFAAASTSACPAPTGTLTNTKRITYLECRVAALEKVAGVTTSATPSSSPSVTPTPTVAPTPTPTPSPTVTPTVPPTPTTGFPDATNTGPTGALATYAGPLLISKATVITSAKVTGTLVVKAPLTIVNSEVDGTIDNDNGQPVVITDSLIDGGTNNSPAVGYGDLTITRTEVTGARVSVLCGANCVITDSWLHNQYLKPGSDWHVNGYLSNGGSNVVIRHNTLACDPRDNAQGGGCTGPAASFGDFAPLTNITYDANLFKASPGGYCLAAGHNPSKPFGANPTRITVTNNVFERGPGGKCASFGPVTSFLVALTNVYSGNRFDDGAVVPSAD